MTLDVRLMRVRGFGTSKLGKTIDEFETSNAYDRVSKIIITSDQLSILFPLQGVGLKSYSFRGIPLEVVDGVM